jgi:hypothetical protein
MKVDFFIIGAPKCGTTALAYYLSQHPAVCIANPKEPWFFSNDLTTGYPDMPTTIDGYHERFFSHCDSADHGCIGEASPVYMVSNCAVDNILKYNPKAKFIAMLRNPVDIAYAMHANRVATSSRHENVANFERAWRLQNARKEGRDLPPDVIKPILLQYKEIASIGTQLKRVKEKVDHGNLHIIVNEDMRSDTRKIYDETLAFLGLDPFPGCDFSPANENRSWTNNKIRTLFHAGQQLKKKLRIPLNMGLLTTLKNRNMRVAPRANLSAEFRAELVEEFRPEVELLSSMLHRDFSEWK